MRIPFMSTLHQFLMLSDTALAVARTYGALLSRPGLANRNLFVVGPDGNIAYRALPFREVDPKAYTDLGAAIQGGLGLAASGNIHPGRVSMFEPIHGSAPKHAGKHVICPYATVSALQMLLAELKLDSAAERIDRAIGQTLSSGKVPSLSTNSGIKTPEYTDILLSFLK